MFSGARSLLARGASWGQPLLGLLSAALPAQDPPSVAFDCHCRRFGASRNTDENTPSRPCRSHGARLEEGTSYERRVKERVGEERRGGRKRTRRQDEWGNGWEGRGGRRGRVWGWKERRIEKRKEKKENDKMRIGRMEIVKKYVLRVKGKEWRENRIGGNRDEGIKGGEKRDGEKG